MIQLTPHNSVLTLDQDKTIPTCFKVENDETCSSGASGGVYGYLEVLTKTTAMNSQNILYAYSFQISAIKGDCKE